MFERFNLNPNVTLGVALTVLVLILGYRMLSDGSTDDTTTGTPVKSPIKLAWYYDTVDKKVFAAPGKVPPFDNEAGHECVQAMMYSCGPCDEENRYVAYYQKLNSSGGVLISQTAAPDSWIASNSPEGSKLIMDRTLGHCPEGRPTPCWPEPTGAIKPPPPE